MTLNYGIFDVSDPQNPDRVYSATLLSRILSKHIRDGVVHDDGNEMAVTVTDPPAMRVLVGTGTAMIRGRFCENDAALTLSVPAAHATYPRIDRVVVRLNASPGRTIDIVVKPGTAAPKPAAPALTRTAEIWELSLAQIRVEAGATSILSAKITDERGSASLCGIASPAYVPSSVLEIVEGLVMQGMPLVGLPTPTSSTGAATKHYVDSQITEKISGFGISQIAIDADKDWNNKAITNLGSLTSHGKTILNSSGEFAGGGAAYVLYGDPACAAANLCNQVSTEYSRSDLSYGKMVELSPIPSSVAIPNMKHTVTVQWQTKIYYGAPYAGCTRVYINGSAVGVEKITSSTGYTTVSETIEVEPGDIISIWGHSTQPSEYGPGTVYVSNVKLFAFAVPAGRPPMW